jgi:hypothetical protein
MDFKPPFSVHPSVLLPLRATLIENNDQKQWRILANKQLIGYI